MQTQPQQQQPPSASPPPMSAKKAHVSTACVHCKKAHLACDDQRPCRRCVATGRADSCFDAQHKKRGRPRLHRFEDAARSDTLGLISSGLGHRGEVPLVVGHPMLSDQPLFRSLTLSDTGNGFDSDSSRTSSVPMASFQHHAALVVKKVPVVQPYGVPVGMQDRPRHPRQQLPPKTYSLSGVPDNDPRVTFYLSIDRMLVITSLGDYLPSILGFQNQELLGVSLYDLTHAQDRPVLARLHQAVLVQMTGQTSAQQTLTYRQQPGSASSVMTNPAASATGGDAGSSVMKVSPFLSTSGSLHIKNAAGNFALFDVLLFHERSATTAHIVCIITKFQHGLYKHDPWFTASTLPTKMPQPEPIRPVPVAFVAPKIPMPHPTEIVAYPVMMPNPATSWQADLGRKPQPVPMTNGHDLMDPIAKQIKNGNLHAASIMSAALLPRPPLPVNLGNGIVAAAPAAYGQSFSANRLPVRPPPMPAPVPFIASSGNGMDYFSFGRPAAPITHNGNDHEAFINGHANGNGAYTNGFANGHSSNGTETTSETTTSASTSDANADDESLTRPSPSDSVMKRARMHPDSRTLPLSPRKRIAVSNLISSPE